MEREPDELPKKEPTVCQRHAKNFETLRRAIKNGDVCLLECVLNSTGEKHATICIATMNPETEEIDFMPFAIFLNGNPYELMTPPGNEAKTESAQEKASPLL